MRALQTYAQPTQRGTVWLLKARPKTTEDRAFHLLGLSWARADRRAIQRAVR